MKIEGNTITFKSWPHNYKLEKRGLKPATVRILTNDEEQAAVHAFSGNYYLFRHINTPRPKIRIVVAGTEKAYFERELLSIEKVGEILNAEIWLFCWRHEEEKQ